MTVYLVVFDKTAYEFSEKLFTGITSYIDDLYVELCECEESLLVEECSRAPEPRKQRRRMMPSEAVVERAMAKKSIDDFIHLDEGFAVKLLKLIDAKGMTDVACYKKANVSKQTWYKIMNEKGYKPNKKTVISFAVALELTVGETQELLESVGFILSNSSLFDVIIRYCIENAIYDVLEIDSVLFRYDQETLYSKQ